MRIVNLTPHVINIVDDNGNIIRKYEPAGIVARVSVDKQAIGVVDGIPIFKAVYKDAVGLPAPHKNILYIVSNVVAQALRGTRNDLIVPDTNDAVRDADGQIIGVKGFMRF